MEQRGAIGSLSLEREVRSILKNVKMRGDEALLHYTQRFDGIRLSADRFQVEAKEIRKAYKRVPSHFLETLGKAARRILRFHRLQVVRSIDERREGIRLGQIIRPLERVGIYVPGGKASYPSTVLMAAIPAKVAGVKEIVMTTPPHREGVSPAVLVAADLAGVDRIYRVGGAQAVGALAYGTETIPKVDKIVGPGNRYVAVAKRLIYGVVDIDMIAGPSEILIIADGRASASSVAADLISQAEHDEVALPILITPSERLAKEVKPELERQLSSLRRSRIAYASLNGRGAILIVKNLLQGVDLANRIAPEHLELCVSNPSALLKDVKHAGTVFLGAHTPEAIGDYLAGPNHILPTGGTARFASALGVEDFIKRTNVVGFTRAALKRFERDVKRFAEWEGLEGHYRAVRMRLNS
jgi:histidinol dehydrogenase